MFQRTEYQILKKDSNSGLGEFRKQFKDAKALIVGEGGLKAEEFLQMKLEMLF